MKSKDEEEANRKKNDSKTLKKKTNCHQKRKFYIKQFFLQPAKQKTLV